MDTLDTNTQQSVMSLRVALFHWVGCLVAFILLVVIASLSGSTLVGYLAFFFYIGAGVYLNRAVLRKIIDWHPIYNTLHNVSSAKLKSALFWPLSYFFLFVRLGINRAL